MSIEYLSPEFEILRMTQCICCRICEQQCANEIHIYDSQNHSIQCNDSKCVNCQRCVSLCPTKALKIIPNRNTLRDRIDRTGNIIKEIYKQANSGGVLLSSTGKSLFASRYWDHILLNASQVTNPSIDPLREPMETKIYLGNETVADSRRNSFPTNAAAAVGIINTSSFFWKVMAPSVITPTKLRRSRLCTWYLLQHWRRRASRRFLSL